jgi:HAD superfamily hydrolase (TIGR01509 family)
MSLRGLIFDVDGTLADTEEVHRQAFNAAFALQRLPWFWGHRVYCELLKVAGGRERLAHFIDALEISAAEKMKLLARVAAIHSDKTRFYARFVAEGRVALREGVSALLEEARHADLKLALATTTSYANVEALFTHSLGRQALKWFAVTATGETRLPKKPAPDIYIHVLGKLRLAPREVIAFEDSEIGVKAAKAAGIFTVVAPTIWTAGDDLSAADLRLDGLATRCDVHSLAKAYSRSLKVRGREAA